jgi:hypothetical protein
VKEAPARDGLRPGQRAGESRWDSGSAGWAPHSCARRASQADTTLRLDWNEAGAELLAQVQSARRDMRRWPQLDPAVVVRRSWFMLVPEFQNSYLVFSPKFLLAVTHLPLPLLAVTVHTSFLSLYR